MLKQIIKLAVAIALVLNSQAFADTAKSKIVILAPLSGPVSEYGIATVNGIELAKKNNPDLKNQFDILIEDNQYDPSVTVGLYRKYRSDKTVKLIYNWGSNPSGSIIPIADKECFPLFTVDLSISEYQKNKKEGQNCVFNFVNSELDVTKPLAEYLIKMNYRKIGIIKTENAYINGIIRGLIANSNHKFDLEIVSAVDQSLVDFSPLILKMKNKTFDSLGIFIFPGQLRKFYQQMQTLKYEIPTFGTDVFESKEEIRLAGKNMQGAVYSHLDVSNEFRKLYNKNFSNDSQITSAGAAYDFINFIATVLAKYPKSNGSELVNIIKKMPKQNGVLGDYYFEENQVEGARFKFPVYLKTINGDSFSINK